jgi:small nuclear ribonucleoprotein (snRNP)-like protein
MNESRDILQELLGRDVVIDASSQYVFVGTLAGYDNHYVILNNSDVHDLRDTTTTRDLYVLETKRLGTRSNRRRVLVRREEVVSISALDDVIE